MLALLLQSDADSRSGSPDNLVQAFSDRTYMVFGFALAPFLTPFSIYSFYSERPVMRGLTALIITCSLINSIGILRGRKRVLPYCVVYLPILAAFGWGMVTVSPMVALWCYPVATVTLFVSSRPAGRL